MQVKGGLHHGCIGRIHPVGCRVPDHFRALLLARASLWTSRRLRYPVVSIRARFVRFLRIQKISITERKQVCVGRHRRGPAPWIRTIPAHSLLAWTLRALHSAQRAVLSAPRLFAAPAPPPNLSFCPLCPPSPFSRPSNLPRRRSSGLPTTAHGP